MPDRAIIFSAPMVRALIGGRKTQTRRVLKPQPVGIKAAWLHTRKTWNIVPESHRCTVEFSAPPYAPGDRLYVREAWRSERGLDRQNATEMGAACLDAGYSRVWAPIFYEVDASRVCFENGMVAGRYRHARFMPRWASRLTLTVTDVRVQRLQDISEADAQDEGCNPSRWEMLTPRDHFRTLWNSLHGPEAWAANPWVVALTFSVEHRNIDAGAPA